jgi:hypothetical protein
MVRRAFVGVNLGRVLGYFFVQSVGFFAIPSILRNAYFQKDAE